MEKGIDPLEKKISMVTYFIYQFIYIRREFRGLGVSLLDSFKATIFTRR